MDSDTDSSDGESHFEAEEGSHSKEGYESESEEIEIEVWRIVMGNSSRLFREVKAFRVWRSL